MTYYVNEKCKGCKYTDCVLVCPVDCFYELDDMLVIDPETCIDCGVCVPECPVDAIKSDCDDSIDLDESEEWLDFNAKFSKTYKNQNIKTKKEPICKYPKEWNNKKI
jgi:ferredoxin